MTTETRFLTRQPPINTVTKGGVDLGDGAILLHRISQVWWLMAPGTPVDGAQGTGGGWANTGSLFTDQTGGNLYINGGTAASPTWKLVTRAA